MRNKIISDSLKGTSFENFVWVNRPSFIESAGRLIVATLPNTDFWQKTHYGFERDTGHALLSTSTKDFSMAVKTTFSPTGQYDQCGLLVRLNPKNWIKISTEYESPNHSRLGSVVTNFGFSDWATTDLNESPKEMWYRIQSKARQDFFLEYSRDGLNWYQMRIARLQESFESLQIGIYACSPMETSFEAIFEHFSIGESNWT